MSSLVTDPNRAPDVRPVRQKDVNAYFADVSSYWEDVYARDDLEGQIYRDRMTAIEAMVDGLELAPHARALDIGCGSGSLAIRLARRGLQVEALDSVPEMVQRASRNVSASDEKVSVRLGDAANLDFPDENFDLITAVGVLPWASEPHQVLCEIVRTLRPGRFAVITVDNLHRLNFLVDPWLHPAIQRVKPGVKKLLSGLGLSLRPEQRVIGRFHTERAASSLLQSAGLMVRARHTVGFGPFTVFGKSLLPDKLGQQAHAVLQGLADEDRPIVRATGSHLIYVCQKRSDK